jgi:hypothetical protein
MKSALPLGFLVTSLCFLSACGESQTPSFRQYQEISKTTSLSKQSPSLTWRTPLTWKDLLKY